MGPFFPFVRGKVRLHSHHKQTTPGFRGQWTKNRVLRNNQSSPLGIQRRDNISHLPRGSVLSREMNSRLLKVEQLTFKGPTIKENQQRKQPAFLQLFSSQLVPHAPFLWFYSDSLSIPLPHTFFSPSVLKGQTFPAVTTVAHWYSALNLAESRTAVSASSDHTEIRHGARHRGRRGAQRIKGSENCEGNGEERTDKKPEQAWRHLRASLTAQTC